MKVKISTTNSKLGYQIPSISLPPQHTCRPDAPCAKNCYAKKGHFLYKNVQESHQNNLDVYLNNSDDYFNQIIEYLNSGLITYKLFRYHVSGDIVDYNYLLGMVKTAKKCKQTKFLCFTKKFDIVNQFLEVGNRLPSNLKIVFSAWHKGFKVDNPFNLPIAYVFFKKQELNPSIPELAIPCQGHCETCIACWELKNGQSVYFNQH